jgi:hypothetical protein
MFRGSVWFVHVNRHPANRVYCGSQGRTFSGSLVVLPVSRANLFLRRDDHVLRARAPELGEIPFSRDEIHLRKFFSVRFRSNDAHCVTGLLAELRQALRDGRTAKNQNPYATTAYPAPHAPIRLNDRLVSRFARNRCLVTDHHRNHKRTLSRPQLRRLSQKFVKH